jgi:hypothetical protein
MSRLNMADWRLMQADWCSPEELSGNLAEVVPTPERKQIRVRVMWPHPAAERLTETLMHEFVHAKISPLTALIRRTSASVMIEEGIVEDLGVILASTDTDAARVVARALPAGMRARVTAALRHNRRSRMDVNMLLAALRAALTAEDPKAAIESLLGEVEKMAGSGGADSARPEDPQMCPEGGGADEAEQGGLSAAYRKGSRPVSATELRARRAADVLSQSATRALLREARGDGITLDAAAERELLELRDVDAAEQRIGWLRRGLQMAGGDEERASSGAKTRATTSSAGGEAREALIKEGFAPQWVDQYEAMKRESADAAASFLDGARRARSAAPNPWTKKEVAK